MSAGFDTKYIRFTIPSAPNMISNGTFDSGDDWAFAGSGFSIGSGVASFDDSGNGYLRQTDAQMVSSIAINTEYKLEFDLVVTGIAALAIINYGTGVNYVALDYYNGTQHITLIFTTPADIAGGGIGVMANNGGEAFTIDNMTLTLN